VLLGEDGAPFLQSDKPKAYVIKGKSWVNNHAHVLRALDGTPSLFWKYQFDQVQYRPFVSGTTRLKLSQAPMCRIPLLVPPLPEQHRIVDAIESYFTRLDDAVATLERVQRNLKRYRASVLKAAVEGRLVPTEAELARADGRDYEPASVLLERILAERRRRWQEAGGRSKYEEPAVPDTTELPELPEGWCWATADTLADLKGGTSLSRESRRLIWPRST
jgi:type I restriction enzyme S subunit